MNIEVLRNFLVLAGTLHFTRASDKTFIAQPALSRQIRQLEEEVGAQLFFRNKRNVELTSAGTYFRGEVERMLRQFDFAVRRTERLHRGEAGEIRIGYTHSAMQGFLPGLVHRIHEKLPDIRIVLLEYNNVRQYEALKNGDIDVGFSTNPEPHPDFHSKLMFRENFAVAFPEGHPAVMDEIGELAALKEESFIMPPKAEGPMYVAVLESIFVDAGFLPHIVHETPFASTAIRLVETGIGLTVEPVSSLRSYKGIKYAELKHIPQKVEIFMLWLPVMEQQFPEMMELLKQ
ncbi:LysR substrate-binding domain-containing protein [Sinomicrobium soli]|uniref:LysR substrate-binding domain-containing protein n=1 Tax=Sinomicrobium sp. N-1-3-6 TaxID=2219864 RepID=UPI000DCB57B7|nr:LysR substrate-binding domain-containing protein [Sinomicrobium sp. N-1-3-6]RAV27938.1 LysR family transcriptional regulator [Sinomicrobium sp. N-1-3-6]